MSDLPSRMEIQSEDDPIRKEILEAIVRVLEERPLRAQPGDMSILALSQEADVKRHWLNGRHMDLRERFVFLRDRADDLTALEASLSAQLEVIQGELTLAKERVRDLTEERDNWKSAAEVFLRAMNVQERDLDRLQTEVDRLSRRLQKATEGQDELAVQRHRRPLAGA